MGDPRVLSTEEVDAILKVTQEKNQDLSNIVANGVTPKEQGKEYAYALGNINEMTRSECEKNFSSFLRKKIILKSNSFNPASLTPCLTTPTDKNVYSVFRILPHERYGIIMFDLSLLHQSINLLYGGKINTTEPIINSAGKIGLIVAEKLCQLCLDSFIQACQEYGPVNIAIVKSTCIPNLASNLGLTEDEPIYSMEFSVFFDEIETCLKVIISEDFLSEFIPARVEGSKHKEKDFWRTAIKTQVVDSIVNVNVTLPDLNMKVKEFMALKEGDIIPISDPTAVYVCLNNIKLFRATAGQSNSKLVVKIISQI